MKNQMKNRALMLLLVASLMVGGEVGAGKKWFDLQTGAAITNVPDKYNKGTTKVDDPVLTTSTTGSGWFIATVTSINDDGGYSFNNSTPVAEIDEEEDLGKALSQLRTEYETKTALLSQLFKFREHGIEVNKLTNNPSHEDIQQAIAAARVEADRVAAAERAEALRRQEEAARVEADRVAAAERAEALRRQEEAARVEADRVAAAERAEALRRQEEAARAAEGKANVDSVKTPTPAPIATSAPVSPRTSSTAVPAPASPTIDKTVPVDGDHQAIVTPTPAPIAAPATSAPTLTSSTAEKGAVAASVVSASDLTIGTNSNAQAPVAVPAPAAPAEDAQAPVAVPVPAAPAEDAQAILAETYAKSPELLKKQLKAFMLRKAVKTGSKRNQNLKLARKDLSAAVAALEKEKDKVVKGESDVDKKTRIATAEKAVETELKAFELKISTETIKLVERKAAFVAATKAVADAEAALKKAEELVVDGEDAATKEARLATAKKVVTDAQEQLAKIKRIDKHSLPTTAPKWYATKGAKVGYTNALFFAVSLMLQNMLEGGIEGLQARDLETEDTRAFGDKVSDAFKALSSGSRYTASLKAVKNVFVADAVRSEDEAVKDFVGRLGDLYKNKPVFATGLTAAVLIDVLFVLSKINAVGDRFAKVPGLKFLVK